METHSLTDLITAAKDRTASFLRLHNKEFENHVAHEDALNSAASGLQLRADRYAEAVLLRDAIREKINFYKAVDLSSSLFAHIESNSIYKLSFAVGQLQETHLLQIHGDKLVGLAEQKARLAEAELEKFKKSNAPLLKEQQLI